MKRREWLRIRFGPAMVGSDGKWWAVMKAGPDAVRCYAMRCDAM